MLHPRERGAPPARGKRDFSPATGRRTSRLPLAAAPAHVLAMSSLPAQFVGVTVVPKANVYFDGQVVSHTVLLTDGSKKTLGLIRVGSYHFNTAAPERMEIIAGQCTVQLDGAASSQDYGAGTHFDVPRDSGFTIKVDTGLCEYICSFLP